MTRPGSIQWGKFSLLVAGLTAAGWGLMAVLTPTEEQLYSKLAPDLKAKVDKVRAEREASSPIQEKLKSLEQGEDQVVWGDQLNAKPKPPTAFGQSSSKRW